MCESLRRRCRSMWQLLTLVERVVLQAHLCGNCVRLPALLAAEGGWQLQVASCLQKHLKPLPLQIPMKFNSIQFNFGSICDVDSEVEAGRGADSEAEPEADSAADSEAGSRPTSRPSGRR